MITFDEFEKVEMRVGTIIEVEDFAEARKPAYKLKIDFGKYGVKQSSAQITKLYTKAELINRQIVAVINFPTKRIAGFISECLVLGVENSEKNVVLLQVERQVHNGVKIF